MEILSFGVDDVEVFIPADVQINTFSNDRQQLPPGIIADLAM
jgi:hypothetical protein